MGTAQLDDLDVYLICSLAGISCAREKLPFLVQSYFRKLARKMAASFPKDIWEEMVQQACENVQRLDRNSFNPDRGSAKAFLALLFRGALRQVAATYAPAGHTTRTRKTRKKSAATGPKPRPSCRRMSLWKSWRPRTPTP
jgi:hypothetical protein